MEATDGDSVTAVTAHSRRSRWRESPGPACTHGGQVHHGVNSQRPGTLGTVSEAACPSAQKLDFHQCVQSSM